MMSQFLPQMRLEYKEEQIFGRTLTAFLKLCFTKSTAEFQGTFLKILLIMEQLSTFYDGSISVPQKNVANHLINRMPFKT